MGGNSGCTYSFARGRLTGRLGLITAAVVVMVTAVSVNVAGRIVAVGLFFVDCIISVAARGVVFTTGIFTATAGSTGILQIQAVLVTGADRSRSWAR